MRLNRLLQVLSRSGLSMVGAVNVADARGRPALPLLQRNLGFGLDVRICVLRVGRLGIWGFGAVSWASHTQTRACFAEPGASA